MILSGTQEDPSRGTGIERDGRSERIDPSRAAAVRTDRLWVPLLTHYAEDAAGPRVDCRHMAAHINALAPNVRQFLIGGSTGDGWELTWPQLMDLVALSRRGDLFGAEARVLFGVLRPTTEEVVERARALERSFGEGGWPAGRFAGLAVCPPVDPVASQDAIRAHYEAVLGATTSPIAVYQLPQVTGCAIAPETLRIIASNPRVTMFKDTSGADTVANAGPFPGVVLLRGAEGGFVEALSPAGPYDGWLLSTGNAFGAVLRRMLDLLSAGESSRAARLSRVLTHLVGALFDAAAEVPFGNPFSNANRAADHLQGFGADWRSVEPPLTISGQRLPSFLLDAAEDLLALGPSGLVKPYLA